MTQSSKEVLRSAVGVQPSRESEPALLVAEIDVLSDAQAIDKIQLLVDRGDTVRHRGFWVREPGRLPVPCDRAVIGLMRTGKHLDQRRLTSTVLAEEAVDFAWSNAEVHAV